VCLCGVYIYFMCLFVFVCVSMCVHLFHVFVCVCMCVYVCTFISCVCLCLYACLCAIEMSSSPCVQQQSTETCCSVRFHNDIK
jgi:hypothetical protein